MKLISPNTQGADRLPSRKDYANGSDSRERAFWQVIGVDVVFAGELGDDPPRLREFHCFWIDHWNPPWRSLVISASEIRRARPILNVFTRPSDAHRRRVEWPIPI